MHIQPDLIPAELVTMVVPPPPSVFEFYVIVGFYDGRGWLKGNWSVRNGSYATREEAIEAAKKLPGGWTHVQVFKLTNKAKVEEKK